MDAERERVLRQGSDPGRYPGSRIWVGGPMTRLILVGAQLGHAKE